MGRNVKKPVWVSRINTGEFEHVGATFDGEREYICRQLLALGRGVDHVQHEFFVPAERVELFVEAQLIAKVTWACLRVGGQFLVVGWCLCLAGSWTNAERKREET